MAKQATMGMRAHMLLILWFDLCHSLLWLLLSLLVNIIFFVIYWENNFISQVIEFLHVILSDWFTLQVPCCFVYSFLYYWYFNFVVCLSEGLKSDFASVIKMYLKLAKVEIEGYSMIYLLNKRCGILSRRQSYNWNFVLKVLN